MHCRKQIQTPNACQLAHLRVDTRRDQIEQNFCQFFLPSSSYQSPFHVQKGIIKGQEEKPRVLVFTEKGPLVKTSAQMTEWAQKTSKLLINSVLVLSFPDQQYFFPKKKKFSKNSHEVGGFNYCICIILFIYSIIFIKHLFWARISVEEENKTVNITYRGPQSRIINK